MEWMRPLRSAVLLLLWGCESTHFPTYIPDQGYSNGHPLAVNTPDSSLTQIEDDIVQMTNAARTAAGLPPLTRLQPLDAVARGFSAHMPLHHFYGHVDPEGNDPTIRMGLVAKGWNQNAENIALANDGTASSDIFQEFMNSPDHKANLLSPLVDSVGVGVIRGPHYLLSNQMALYVTMEFVNRL